MSFTPNGTAYGNLIRVATFNLKHGATAEGYIGHPHEAAEACASLEADILALQEVDRFTVRSGWRDMAALAAKACDMRYVFKPTMRFVCGTYGNALLVRGDIDSDDVLKMRGGHRFRTSVGSRRLNLRHEARNAILASVRVGGQDLTVAATHLSPERLANRRQLPRVVTELSKRPKPHLLLGDTNMTKSQMEDEFLICPMDVAEAPPTYPSLDPTRGIDHIAVNGLRILSAKSVKLPISDHRALIAEVAPE